MKTSDHTHRILLVLFALGIGMISGCSENYPLSGKVVYSDNGEPLTGGAVIFTTETHVAQGVIKKNGTYVVGSLKSNDGIPPGDYKIYIGGAEIVTTKKQPDGSEQNTYTSLIDGKYRSSETSGLTFTADGKTRKFDIELDRAK